MLASNISGKTWWNLNNFERSDIKPVPAHAQINIGKINLYQDKISSGFHTFWYIAIWECIAGYCFTYILYEVRRVNIKASLWFYFRQTTINRTIVDLHTLACVLIVIHMRWLAYHRMCVDCYTYETKQYSYLYVFMYLHWTENVLLQSRDSKFWYYAF